MVKFDLPVIPGATHIEVLRSAVPDGDPSVVIGRVRNGTLTFEDEAPFEGAAYSYRGVLDVDGDNDFKTGPVALAFKPLQPPIVVSYREVILSNLKRGLSVVTSMADRVIGSSSGIDLTFHEEPADTGAFKMYTAQLPTGAVAVTLRPARGAVLGATVPVLLSLDQVPHEGEIYPPPTDPPEPEPDVTMGTAEVAGDTNVFAGDTVSVFGSGSTFDEVIVAYAGEEITRPVVDGAWSATVAAVLNENAIQIQYVEGGVLHDLQRVIEIGVTERAAPAAPVFTITTNPAYPDQPLDWTALFPDLGDYTVESVELLTLYTERVGSELSVEAGGLLATGDPITAGSPGADQQATIILTTAQQGRTFEFPVTYDVDEEPEEAPEVPVTATLTTLPATPVQNEPFVVTHTFTGGTGEETGRTLDVDGQLYPLTGDSTDPITVALSGPAPMSMIYHYADGDEVEVLEPLPIEADPDVRFFDPNALPVGEVAVGAGTDWTQVDGSRPVARLYIEGEQPNQVARINTGSSGNNDTGLYHQPSLSVPLGCFYGDLKGHRVSHIYTGIGGVYFWYDDGDNTLRVLRAGQASFFINGITSDRFKIKTRVSRPEAGKTLLQIKVKLDTDADWPAEWTEHTYNDELEAAGRFGFADVYGLNNIYIYGYGQSADPDKEAPTAPIARAVAPPSLSLVAVGEFGASMLMLPRHVEGGDVRVLFDANNFDTVTPVHSGGASVAITKLTTASLHEAVFQAAAGAQELVLTAEGAGGTVDLVVPITADAAPAENPAILGFRTVPAQPYANEDFGCDFSLYAPGLDIADIITEIGGQDFSLGRRDLLPEGAYDATITILFADGTSAVRTVPLPNAIIARPAPVNRAAVGMAWQGNEAGDPYPQASAPNLVTHAKTPAELMQRPAGQRFFFDQYSQEWWANHPAGRARKADGTLLAYDPAPARVSSSFYRSSTKGWSTPFAYAFAYEMRQYAKGRVAAIKAAADAASVPYGEAVTAITFDDEFRMDSSKVSGGWESAIIHDPIFRQYWRPVASFFLRRLLRGLGRTNDATVFYANTESAADGRPAGYAYDTYEADVWDALWRYAKYRQSYVPFQEEFQEAFGSDTKVIALFNYEEGGQDVGVTDGQGGRKNLMTPWIYTKGSFQPHLASAAIFAAFSAYGYRGYDVEAGVNVSRGDDMEMWLAHALTLREAVAAMFKGMAHSPWFSNLGVSALGWDSPHLTTPPPVLGAGQTMDDLAHYGYFEEQLWALLLSRSENGAFHTPIKPFNTHTAPDTATHAIDATDGLTSGVIGAYNDAAGTALPRRPRRDAYNVTLRSKNELGNRTLWRGDTPTWISQTLADGTTLYRVSVPRYNATRRPSQAIKDAWGTVTVKAYRDEVEVDTLVVPAGDTGILYHDDVAGGAPIEFIITEHADAHVNIGAGRQDMTDAAFWSALVGDGFSPVADAAHLDGPGTAYRGTVNEEMVTRFTDLVPGTRVLALIDGVGDQGSDGPLIEITLHKANEGSDAGSGGTFGQSSGVRNDEASGYGTAVASGEVGDSGIVDVVVKLHKARARRFVFVVGAVVAPMLQ